MMTPEAMESVDQAEKALAAAIVKAKQFVDQGEKIQGALADVSRSKRLTLLALTSVLWLNLSIVGKSLSDMEAMMIVEKILNEIDESPEEGDRGSGAEAGGDGGDGSPGAKRLDPESGQADSPGA